MFVQSLSRENGGEGKLSLGVVEVGAGRKSTHSDTHRIMFTLQPFSTTTGKPPTINDRLPAPPPRPTE
ncbi:trypco2 family protein [Planobispora takensis]|uniref:Trypsin-co-occurring domain-containing protein n=1 Tax=Planobispora takensis TaxID=1367882 RepID=A0A8J3SRN8_9ACTN|nr:hypothetical protein Pta02_13620 [Planobispora takensis]